MSRTTRAPSGGRQPPGCGKDAGVGRSSDGWLVTGRPQGGSPGQQFYCAVVILRQPILSSRVAPDLRDVPVNPTADQFTGCLLGLATGDALGAPHEGGPLERFVWWWIGRTSDGSLRWTDDTQMALDLAESLLADNGVHPESLATRFASSYRWSRGYGPAAGKVLKRIRRGEPWQQASKSVYADGSYGNGAAMRAPILALFYSQQRDKLIAAAQSSARVTHAHPLGIEGAVLIAIAAHALLERLPTAQVLNITQADCVAPQFFARLETVRSWIESHAAPSPREVAATLGNGITAPTSCPTALYVALRHLNSSFEAMMEFVMEIRGDVDTIGAMSGALWGIANGTGRLPNARIETRELLLEVAMRLFQRQSNSTLSADL